MVKNFLFCGVVALLVSGCAFSRTETLVHFSPPITSPLAVQKKAALVVGEFTDSRLIQDKYVLLQKANGYGQTTSGAFVTKEPVADILKKGLTEALEKNGFGTNGTAEYELHGELQSFAGDVIMGLWSSTTKAQLTVRFELVKKDSGIAVWHDTFKGQTSKKTEFGGADFYAELFSEAGNELAKNLITDKTFRSFFE